MYKVYILKRTRHGSEVLKDLSTRTASPAAAKVAFWEIRKNPSFEGKKFILLMTKNGEKLNVHDFASTNDQIALDSGLVI